MMSQTQRSGPNVDAAAAALGESSSSSDGADASTSQPKLSERFAFLPDGVVQVYGRKLMLSPTHITTFRQCPRLYELFASRARGQEDYWSPSRALRAFVLGVLPLINILRWRYPSFKF